MKPEPQRVGLPTTELERKLEELPLLPAVVIEVLSLNTDADDYFVRLLHVAERDPPFAIRVLRSANSASSAPASPIVSLRQAFMRLGTRQCANLVLALAVVKLFIPRSVMQRLLWIHSLQTALFARMFCERIPAVRVNADLGYLCGLLHDIGRFVQFQGSPADSTRIDDMQGFSPQELVGAERDALGYDHAMLGGHACTKWSLPATIGDVVRRHHETLPVDDASLDLVRVVQWADALSGALLMNPALAAAPAEELSARLAAEHSGIGPATLLGEQSLWHPYVPDVRAESMELARQLRLIERG